jgi:hypothetical protein
MIRIERAIKGASGNLYDYRSDAGHLAIEQLWEQLHAIGFKLPKKPAHESTLRVYPTKYKQPPLLNPRFQPTAVDLDAGLDKESLVFTILSRGTDEAFDRPLRTFPSTGDCTFIPDDGETGEYRYHGYFVFPLHFLGAPGEQEIDFDMMKEPLTHMLDFLRQHY